MKARSNIIDIWIPKFEEGKREEADVCCIIFQEWETLIYPEVMIGIL
jgi:hypothetical protein